MIMMSLQVNCLQISVQLNPITTAVPQHKSAEAAAALE